jgi:hypothetical protein
VTAPQFPYKTQPLPKQREALRVSVRQPYFALFMQQGTGKSKVTCDTAAWLWLNKKIDAMIVVAPSGVHTQWALDQLPTHMSDAVPWRAHIWRSQEQRAAFNARKELPYEAQEWDVSELAKDLSVLAVLCVNSEALPISLCERAVGTFLTRRRCLLVVDESGTGFSRPSGKRARTLFRLRDRAPYRRILEGVPAQNPFELYAPLRFLSPKILGFDTFAKMKEHHADWIEIARGAPGSERTIKIIATDASGKKKFKNLDELHEKISRFSFRCTKQEALPDLPPKIFHKRYFELSTEQVRMTLELKEEMRTLFADGASVTAMNKLTQYLRFQQIASGYCPPDQVYGEATEPIKMLPGANPRLELGVAECLRHRTERQIVWTRFHFDIDLLLPRLRDEGFRVVVYDGRMTTDEKEQSKVAFMLERADIFLSNSAAGGVGLNLYGAEHVLYYVNYFGLRKRLQSEDRAHRLGTKCIVNYTDLLGLLSVQPVLGSIDHLVVRALRQSMDVADIITGDPSTDWI